MSTPHPTHRPLFPASPALSRRRPSLFHIALLAFMGLLLLTALPAPSWGASGSASVASNNQDGHEATNGTVTLNWLGVPLGWDNNAYPLGGFLFPGVAIPSGVYISGATVRFQAYSDLEDHCSMDIYGEKTGDAEMFTVAANNLSGRTPTEETVSWGITDDWDRGQFYATDDISSIIQEIVDLGAPDPWSSGNTICLLFDETTSGGDDGRNSFTVEGVAAEAEGTHTATLFFKYTQYPVVATNTGMTVNEDSSGNTIFTADLSYTDPDDDDTTLIYTVKVAPTEGVLRNDGVALSASDTFTQQNINDGKITYDHGGGTTDDTFEFTVQDDDGAETAQATFNITINDKPVVEKNTGFTVNEDSSGNTVFQTTHLSSTDGDDVDTTLVYTITDAPDQGTLQNNGTALGLSDTFTQQDLIDENIAYDHGGGTTDDDFKFTVQDDGGATTAEATFTITINDRPVIATNTGITVNQGTSGNSVFTTHLSSTDADDAAGDIIYTVTEATAEGTLQKNGSALGLSDTFTQQDIVDGNIAYDHGGGTTDDDFKFTVEDDGGAVTTEATFAITINDTPVITNNNPITINEDSSGNTVFHTTHLSATDADDVDTALVYMITTQTTQGTLYLDDDLDGYDAGEELEDTDTFTQQNLIDEKVKYDHGGGTTDDTFDFTVEDDGGAVTAEATFTITINDKPVEVNNEALTVNEDSSGNTIFTTKLSYTDADDADTTLIYTITTQTTQGTLYLDDDLDGYDAGEELEDADTFTQQNLIDEKVKYDHGGGTTDDTFDFTVEDDGGATTAEATFTIVVNDKPVIAANNPVTVNEDSTDNIIGSSDLVSTDADDDDTTLVYTVAVQTTQGTLYLDDDLDGYDAGEELENNDTFTQQHINDDKIRYDHGGGTTNDTFNFTVQDDAGATAAEATFTIVINDKPVIATNSALTVNEDATGTILSNGYLASTDVDDANASLIYTITDATDQGTLRNGGTALGVSDTFTQQNIDDGDVTYDHAGGTADDAFKFTVQDDGGATTAEATFTITINDKPVLERNTGIPVNEDSSGNTIFQTTHLSFTDADDADTTLIYTVTDPTDQGTLYLDDDLDGYEAGEELEGSDTFTQQNLIDEKVKYDHGGGTTDDAFDFTVQDVGGATTAEFTFTITINDKPVITNNNPMTVNEDSSGNTIFYTTHLSATDADDVDTTLIYTITEAPAQGTLRNDGTALGVSDTFTQQDLIDEDIAYDHGGGTTDDDFKFTVQDDDGAAAAEATFSITVNDKPDVSANTGTTVNEDSTDNVITSGELAYTDADDDDTSLLYTVKVVPTNGTLQNLGADLGVGSTFTQQDINSGSINYDHDGSETVADTFEFTVQDDAGAESAQAVFNITINDKPDENHNTGATFDEASSNNEITTAMLEYVDADDGDADITFTLQSVPANGTLQSITTDLGVGDTFTQLDIDVHRINYDHDGSETTSDTFTFTVKDDDDLETGVTPFNITITPVNDTPAITDSNLDEQAFGDKDTITPFDTAGDDLLILDPDAGESLDVEVVILNGFNRGDFTAASSTDSGWTKTPNDPNYEYTQTFAGGDPDGDAQAAVQALVFDPLENLFKPPSDAAKTWFTVEVDDGDVTVNSDEEISVRATSENDPPVITDDGLANQAVDDDDTIALFATAPTLQFDDVDPFDTTGVTVIIVNGVNRGDFSAGTGGYNRDVNGNDIRYWTSAGFVGADTAEANVQGFVFQPRENAILPGSTEETTFTVTIDNQGLIVDSDAEMSVITTSINDAPVLDNTGNMALTAIDEDNTTNNGDLVSAIIASAGGNRITDVDAGAVEGIAVTARDNTNGEWQFSTNGGGAWTAFGAVADNSATLLTAGANDRIRFVPNADWNGSVDPGITFRAWDTTDGNATGDTGVDVSTNGTTTAYSTAAETASITVNPTEDIPEEVNNEGTTVIEDSTGNVITTAMLSFTDVDAGDADADLIYTIAMETVNGTLYKDANANGYEADEELEDTDTFLQDDIDNGRIKYDHGGSDAATDGFRFTVEDGDGDATGQQTFTITITPRYLLTVNSGANGSVASSPAGINCAAGGSDSEEYVTGTDVTLTPTPEDGYSFSGWSGSISGTSSPYILDMNADKNVTASFSGNEDCTPEVNQENSGYAWTSIGTYTFAAGTGSYVTLSCEGDGSVSFDAIWFDHATNPANDITIDSDDGGPTVIYNPDVGWDRYNDNNCEGNYYHRTYDTGDKVTLTPNLPAGGDYEIFVKWRHYSGRDETAHYCVHNYSGHSIISSAGDNGIITPDGSTSFDTGDDQTYNIDPDIDYVIDDVLVDGSSVKSQLGDPGGGVSTFTFYSINADHTIEASFIPADANTTCVDMDQRYLAGQWNQVGTFNFAKGTGSYVYLEISSSYDGSVAADAVKFVNINDPNDTVIIDYDEHDGSASGGTGYFTSGGGWSSTTNTSAYPNASGTKRYLYSSSDGAWAKWVPNIPTTGTYDVYAWWYGHSSRASNVEYCVYNHQGNVIDAIWGENGGVTGFPVAIPDSGMVSVTTGRDETFYILPNEGYVVEYLLVDGTPIDRYEGFDGRASGATTYTFENVQDDHTFEVGFSVGEETVTCIPVNQEESGYAWTDLGTFRFPGGTGAFVTLTHDGGGSISIDAVRFTPSGGGSEIIVDDEDGEPSVVYDPDVDWNRNDDGNCYAGYYHYSYAEGDRVTLMPDLPAAGEYEVAVRWRSSSGRDETAEFCINNHMGKIITATAGSNGVLVTSGVTVESDTTQLFTVLTGATRVFTFHPDDGYVVQDVYVDSVELTCGDSGVSCAEVSGVSMPISYTFTNVQTSHTIEVYFEDHGDTCDQATPVECSSGVSGTISPAGDVDYFTIELAGSGRYTFYTDSAIDTSGRLLDSSCAEITYDEDSGLNNNFSITDDLDPGVYYIEVAHDDATTGTGEYILNVVCEHIVRATARSGGAIDPEDDVIVTHGSGVTFTITPDSGNTIFDVLVDGVSVGDIGTYSFVNVTENHTIEAIFTLPPATCNDISDVPLDALTRGVGSLIMFVLDDSGSMDWEFMTEEGDGLFAGEYYVFNNPGDNLYSNDRILSGDNRGRWKSQWHGYNHIYYNPDTVYEPWPTLPDADLDNPRSHPDNATPTFNLDTTYYTVQTGIIVDNTGTYDSSEIFSDDGTGGAFTATSGDWRRSGAADWYGSDPPRSMYTTVSGATASWVPDLPADGAYTVYVWYTDSGDRDQDAPYWVRHNTGTGTTVYVDQEANEGSWVSLGTYNFTAGAGQGVTLTRFNDNVDAASNDPNTTEVHDDHDSYTCADAVAFVPTVAADIDIPRSHYYVLADTDGDMEVDSGETVYLVSLHSGVSDIVYFEVNTSDSQVGFGDLTPVAADDVPASVRPTNADGSYRTYTEERQNFANWYSFYRRRELTALAAISRTIYDLDSVYVGFRSINGKIKQPVLPINVGDEDELSTLLQVLYDYEGSAYGTPLRRGLEYVGEYYDQEDSNTGDLGSGVTSPWKDQGQGGECQQAFAIVMTDGYYNGSSPYVGGVDNDNDEPYKDTYDDTLADVAMKFYENDLVDPELDNEVPANPYDDATHQHMVTYTVSFGVVGTLDPDNNPATGEPYDVYSGAVTDYPTWPNPGSGSRQKIDDLWHAAVNGRGEYLSASNPDELVNSLTDIMENIAARDGSASSVSINGDQLYGTIGEEVRIFQASYSSGTMSGNVKSYALDQDTGEVLIDSPVWEAAEELDDRVDDNGHTDRIIVTYSLVDGVGGIPFTYSSIAASGTSEQMDDLTPDWSASAAASAENLINYLRGEQTYEVRNAGPFRDRTSRLGDIVHSSPFYHDNILYTGGNDGMLHGFDAETGEELFAYVPGLVYENLKIFGNPDYTHKFYVDLTPYVQEGVDFSGTEKTVLVGGLAKGGKGYYALDITDLSGSTSFASMTESAMADRVLWEFPNSGVSTDIVNDMGYSYSKAYIVPSNDTVNAPWIVIFGNGYNSENSSAVLFILDPTDGSLIKRIDSGVTNCNGLSSPALLDSDLDDKVDYVYAGDLQGNLWKFDLTSTDYNEWGVAFGDDKDLDGAINFDDGDEPQPLFQAQGPSGSLQPITTEPDLMPHCEYPELPGWMIVFGTGKYLGADDLNDYSTQAIYGIWDYGDDEDDDEYLGSFESGSTPQLTNQPDDVTLLQQTFSEYVLDIAIDEDNDGITDRTEEETFRVLSDRTPSWRITTTPDGGMTCGDFPGSTEGCDPNGIGGDGDPLDNAGWYVDFIDPGERMISDPLIRLGFLTYIGFVPEESPCGGEGYSFPNFADPCNGGNLGEAVFDINQDGVIDTEDLINIGSESNPIWVAPTAKKYAGELKPPAIVRMPGSYGESRDKYFLSSSLGDIVTITAKSPRIGIIYWKDLKE